MFEYTVSFIAFRVWSKAKFDRHVGTVVILRILSIQVIEIIVAYQNYTVPVVVSQINTVLIRHWYCIRLTRSVTRFHRSKAYDIVLRYWISIVYPNVFYVSIRIYNYSYYTIETVWSAVVTIVMEMNLQIVHNMFVRLVKRTTVVEGKTVSLMWLVFFSLWNYPIGLNRTISSRLYFFCYKSMKM